MKTGTLQLLPTPCNKKIKDPNFHLEYKFSNNLINLEYTLSSNLFSQFRPLDIDTKQKSFSLRREDKLWEKNCLEFFVSPTHEPGYIEFNFSLDGGWNVFSFDGYRKNKRENMSITLQSYTLEQEREKNRFIARFHLKTKENIQLYGIHGCAILFLNNSPCYFHDLPSLQTPPDFHKFHR